MSDDCGEEVGYDKWMTGSERLDCDDSWVLGCERREHGVGCHKGKYRNFGLAEWKSWRLELRG